MDIAEISKKRFTTKHYNKEKKISSQDIQKLYEVLKNAPSSVNSQPWHFIIVESDDAKKKILPAILEFNHARIEGASQVVIFCAKLGFSEERFQELIEQEDNDRRFSSEELKKQDDEGRRYFVGLNNTSEEKLVNWESKQIYIALGQLLLAAASLKIDSTPIEGFIPEKLDEILNLKEKGLTSVVIASLGYHDENDYNASLPKSRLPEDKLFTFL